MSQTDHCRRPGSHTAMPNPFRLDNRRPVVPLADWEVALLESDDPTLVITPLECDDLSDWDDLVSLDDLPEFTDDNEPEDDDHWLPYVSIVQAREIFGGSDFIVHRAR